MQVYFGGKEFASLEESVDFFTALAVVRMKVVVNTTVGGPNQPSQTTQQLMAAIFLGLLRHCIERLACKHAAILGEATCCACKSALVVFW